MIKGVIFDFDGTLVDYMSGDIRGLQVVYQACGASCGFETFVDLAGREIMIFHDLVDEGKEDPLLMHHFRLKNTCERCGIPWNWQYVSLYQNMLFEQTKPLQGVRELLAFLKKRKIKMGIISNAYDSYEQQTRIKRSGLEPYFDQIVISGGVGYYKPAAKIFCLTLQRLGLVAEDTVYVGDSEKYDIKGAKAVGMKAILLHSKGHDISTKADKVCCSINELQDYMKGLIK